MDIKRNGSQPSARGPAEYFTGTVRIDQLFKAPGPARASGAYVTFEPCARSAWHTHPLGQTLIVTSGCGYVQSWGGPIKVIRPGDVVSCPPGEKHWHGASPTTAMTHIDRKSTRLNSSHGYISYAVFCLKKKKKKHKIQNSSKWMSATPRTNQ